MREPRQVCGLELEVEVAGVRFAARARNLSLNGMFIETDHELRDTAHTIATALATLSTAERELIELKYYANLTLREIAEITGQPAGTVATRYRTALARLRVRLQRNCHE